jgi:molybdopterin-guanine dinucleotide biosynthesis protein A
VNSSPIVFEDITGVILIGGRSSRLGRDKVLLQLDGIPIIKHLHNGLKPLVHEVLLIGHRRPEFDPLGLRVVEDIMPGAGPLGGIYTALVSSETPFVFVVAGDMPFISTSLISTIVQARRDADAVIPSGPRGLEPLCAVYSRSCTEPFGASLEKGNRRIVSALEGLNTLKPEISVRNSEQDPFFNINYPEDLERIKKV